MRGKGGWIGTEKAREEAGMVAKLNSEKVRWERADMLLI